MRVNYHVLAQREIYLSDIDIPSRLSRAQPRRLSLDARPTITRTAGKVGKCVLSRLPKQDGDVDVDDGRGSDNMQRTVVT